MSSAEIFFKNLISIKKKECKKYQLKVKKSLDENNIQVNVVIRIEPTTPEWLNTYRKGFTEHKIPRIDPLPPCRYWYPVSENVVTLDDPILRFIPYFGEQVDDIKKLRYFKGDITNAVELDERDALLQSVFFRLVEMQRIPPKEMDKFADFLVDMYGRDFSAFDPVAFIRQIPFAAKGVSPNCQMLVGIFCKYFEWQASYLMRR